MGQKICPRCGLICEKEQYICPHCFFDFVVNPPSSKKSRYKAEKIKEAAHNPTDWVRIYGMISEAKMFFRNENCLWVDVLTDLPDKELKYFVCCYGDYQTARTYRNEHITLTMEHTIAEGDPYCSRVLHDTRIDWNLKHPPKEFWDNIKI